MKKILYLIFTFAVFSLNPLFSQNFSELAKEHIVSEESDFPKNLKLDDMVVVNQYTSEPSGLTHVYLNQTHDGIKIYNAISNVALDKDGNVFHVGNRFIGHSTKSGSNATLNSIAAVQRAASHYSQDDENATTIELASNDVTQRSILQNSKIASSDITAELVYVNRNGQLVLTWSIAYEKVDDSFWWDTKVSALDGSIVEKTSWTVECNFGHGDDSCDHSDHSGHSHAMNSQRFGLTNNGVLAADDYRVIPIPNESPTHAGGVTSIVTSPWNSNIDPAANPFIGFQGQSWHHDGVTTHFTTRGNNVWAVEDTDADDNQNLGIAPNSQLGGAQQYDFTPNFGNAPSTYQSAAITNLFYWNNLTHDIMYPYGFNEDCGNFQETNATGLGVGGDAVQADAQDGSGTNNANFGTPPEGTNPRMQMFEWTQPASNNTTFSGTTSLIATGLPDNITGGAVPWTAANDGALVLVVDAAGTNEACGTPTPGNIINAAAINGNVALLDRGNCPFSEKVENAEAAGAIGVVVCNNAAGAPISMGGTSTIGIGIPAIMISQADCNTIKAALPGVNVSFNASAVSVNRDSDYDNGVIIHEYGHGISTRLTGGSANSGCLGGDDQMGEGWSDYFGLILTMKSSDTGPQSRGIGTYLLSQPITGNGIRPFPYSTSFATNPMTYTSSGGASGSGGTLTESIPHGVGSVWCTMLWEMTWELVNIYGLGTDIYDNNIANAGTPGAPGTFGGQNLALQLVIEGLKLQPCSPGFVDGRDAILAADQALYGGLHQCIIWEAFARRGLGVSAVQGSSGVVTDNVEAFDVPDLEIDKIANNTLTTDGSTITYDFNVRVCGNETNIVLTDVFDLAMTNVTFVSCTDPLASGSVSGQTLTITHPGGAAGINYTCTVSTVVNSGFAGAPVTLLINDVESGAAGWTINNLVGGAAGQWAITNSVSNSPTNSWFASNTNGPDKTTALESPIFNLSNTSAIKFFHQFDTESGWDGGWLEISTNGGASWTTIPATEFIQNPYTSGLGSGSNTAIGGQPAWTGNSGGFIESIAHLSNFAPSANAQVRFVFGQDDNTNSVGWWVDDITIIDGEYTVVPNVACVSSDQTTTPVCDDADVCVEIMPTACPGTLAASITSSTNISCNGGADGSATVTATGGTAPYTYVWSLSGGTAATASGLTAGTYTVTVTDANMCVVTVSVTLTEPATAIAVTAAETSAIACMGDATGVATATGSGGTGALSYAWSSGGTAAVESGLAVGTYTVTVTDANGCTDNATVTITEPATPVAVTAAQTSAVACMGDATGVATATGTGGTGALSYAWTSGGVTAFESGLATGTYTVTVTDANGCTDNASVTITEPGTAVSVTTSSVAASCGGAADGSATATAAGGTGAYTYSWSSGGTAATETNLAAGSYTVTVTDANNCSVVGTVTVTAGSLVWTGGSPTATDATCSTSNDGTASATATGGTGPYTYNWSNGATGSALSSLAPGTYTVTATDATGCPLVGTATVGAGAGISVAATGNDETCAASADGAATATASAGSGTYTYSWSSGGANATETGLTAGVYTVTVTDSSTGCSATTTVTIGSGAGLTFTSGPSATDASCSTSIDGTLSATVGGNSGTVTIVWTDSAGNVVTLGSVGPGTYTVTASDGACTVTGSATVGAGAGISWLVNPSANDETCSGSSNGSLMATATGGSGTYIYTWTDANGNVESNPAAVTSGTYTVVATDTASGCTVSGSATVASQNGTINFLTGYPFATDETCAGDNTGEITAIAVGGAAPYTYTITDANGVVVGNTGLAAGTYTVLAQDASGCSVTAMVTVNPGIALSWTLVPFATNSSCAAVNDGQVEAIAAGGTAPYTYAWSDSSGNPLVSGPGVGNGSSATTDLGPGTYCVTATDDNGCMISGCATVTAGAGLVWTTVPSATDESCLGNSNGTVSAMANGSTSIVWTDANGNVIGTTGLQAGTYTVVATDANGCSVTGTATVAPGEIEYTMNNGNMLTGTQGSTEDYEVDGAIESDQLVTGGSGVNVDYDSGTCITLKPGFEVTNTTVFHAFIDGCGGAMLRQDDTTRDR